MRAGRDLAIVNLLPTEFGDSEVMLLSHRWRITAPCTRRLLHVANSIEEMRKYRKNVARNATIGFVPTMGALHLGHASLAQIARGKNDIVVASIFVNPTQFSKGEDLDKYPKTLDSDLKMLDDSGVDCVFVPTRNMMYPPGHNSLCHVEPVQFSSILEGKARPDFFRGVATVVTKLFNIVQPNIAYFGQKDISQCILLQRMVTDLNIPVDIQVCGTIRAEDGLALSSRNTYLDKVNERPVANILYRALMAAHDLCMKDVNRKVTREELINTALAILKTEKLVTNVEYVSVASHLDMTELDSVSGASGCVLSSAIRLGSVRLIDNILVGKANDVYRLHRHT